MNDKRKRELQRRWQQRNQRQRQPDPVVGYSARRDLHMVCDGAACVITGSRQQMIAFLHHHGCDPAHYAIEPSSARQILDVLKRGAAYAFDQLAYERLLPLAQAAGLPLEAADFTADPAFPGVPLLHVQLPAAMFRAELR